MIDLIRARRHDGGTFVSLSFILFFQLLPLFVMDVLGSIHGVPGLFVASLFSGALR